MQRFLLTVIVAVSIFTGLHGLFGLDLFWTSFAIAVLYAVAIYFLIAFYTGQPCHAETVIHDLACAFPPILHSHPDTSAVQRCFRQAHAHYGRCGKFATYVITAAIVLWYTVASYTRPVFFYPARTSYLWIPWLVLTALYVYLINAVTASHWTSMYAFRHVLRTYGVELFPYRGDKNYGFCPLTQFAWRLPQYLWLYCLLLWFVLFLPFVANAELIICGAVASACLFMALSAALFAIVSIHGVMSTAKRNLLNDVADELARLSDALRLSSPVPAAAADFELLTKQYTVFELMQKRHASLVKDLPSWPYSSRIAVASYTFLARTAHPLVSILGPLILLAVYSVLDAHWKIHQFISVDDFKKAIGLKGG